MPPDLRKFIVESLHAEPQDVIVVNGVLGLAQFGPADPVRPGRPEVQAVRAALPRADPRPRRRLLRAIREKDILVHHPFESFDVVVQFLRQAAVDPNVLAIKQTLYRTSKDSPIVAALIDALTTARASPPWSRSRPGSTKRPTSAGRGRWSGPGCTWSSASSSTRPTPSSRWWSAARATCCALLPLRHRQLPSGDGQGLHRPVAGLRPIR